MSDFELEVDELGVQVKEKINITLKAIDNALESWNANGKPDHLSEQAKQFEEWRALLGKWVEACELCSSPTLEAKLKRLKIFQEICSKMKE